MKTLLIFAVVVCAACAAPNASGQEVTNAGGELQRDFRGAFPPLDEQVRRRKRSTCGLPSQMSQVNMDFMLKDHNVKRAEIGSSEGSDIIEMGWSDELAMRAQEWAESCIWAHGMTDMCDANIPLGQNMYMVYGNTPDMKHAMNAWFNEKSDYDYATGNCAAGRICGHYTQLVWSESHEVGCGQAVCNNVAVNGEVWEEAAIVVCDYWPSGNWKGEDPYKKGDKCTGCPNSFKKGGITGGHTCDNNLCKKCKPKDDPSCECEDKSSECTNGKWDNGDCKCVCNAGYYGDNCENSCTCEDNAAYKDACPAWKGQGFCESPAYGSFMKVTCPVTCDMCPEKDPSCP